MNIDPKERLAGIPVLKVRALLRKHQQSGLDAEDLDRAFGAHAGKKLLAALLERGLVKAVDVPASGRYELTLTGGALARASAGRPFNRKTAERALADFLDRCHQVRHRTEYLYKVRRALLFGSMLTDKPKVGDVDLAVQLVPKDPAHIAEASREQARRAAQHGRQFSSFFEELTYSHLRVLRFLKSRSRILQLHEHTDGVLDVCDSSVVFEDLAGYPLPAELPPPTDNAAPRVGATRPGRRHRKDDGLPF